jgi:phage antirepressor YoqD-like protein
MSKTAKKFAAKEVAAMCDMTAKNFRKHLRDAQLVANHERAARYVFTQKQADRLVKIFTAETEASDSDIAEAADAE